MEKLILIFSLSIASMSFGSTMNLNCRSAYVDPILYKASLQGPDKNRFYKLKFSYSYMGEKLNYQYDLKKIQKSFIGQKARVYSLKKQKNKTIRLYIETEKESPVDMICKQL